MYAPIISGGRPIESLGEPQSKAHFGKGSLERGPLMIGVGGRMTGREYLKAKSLSTYAAKIRGERPLKVLESHNLRSSLESGPLLIGVLGERLVFANLRAPLCEWAEY
jgi:hypothetical protein